MELTELFTLIDGYRQQYPKIAEVAAMLSMLPFAWILNLLATRALSNFDTSTNRIGSAISHLQKAAGTLFFWYLLLVFLQYIAEQADLKLFVVGPIQSLIAILIIVRYVLNTFKAKNFSRLIIYTVVPLIILNSFNILVPAINALDSYSLDLGNIHISLYDILRVGYFGTILFWVGKELNRLGKQKIRQQETIDNSTREVVAKLFEVGIYVLIFLILLNVLGINLTTLAVLGGAIGVGLGFGLQQIASNFFSGLIILLDRSLSIGDYIELSDGSGGTITQLNLRSATLETFDGKDIVVPNDVFFTESFTNWTHKNIKQRYAINFNVAYDTDLDEMFPKVKEMLRAHPKVLSGKSYTYTEQPDIEIAGFGDNGIDLQIEFWMEQVDDGKNRVGADLLYSLWKLMKENGYEFPFPQREVRVINTSEIPK